MTKLKLTRHLLLSLVVLATCFLTPFLIAQSGLVSRNDPQRSSSPASTKPVAPPGSGSPQSADAGLAHEIDRLIDGGELAQARWGVFVMSMSDGRVLYTRRGDKLFTPASNMKSYTTAVALEECGADYRWRTSVYAYKQTD